MILRHESADPKAKLLDVLATSIERMALSISLMMAMMFPLS